jgi:uncharacterized membrane protein YbhN (UPF0104 family)
MKWRSYYLTAILLIVSVVIIALLERYGMLDLRRVVQAFRRRYSLLSLSAAMIAGMSAIGIVKHYWALFVLKIRVPWRAVAAANLLGQAVATWTPGSMAVAEGLRIGLLLRSVPVETDRTRVLGRMAMASLLDRTISVGTIIWMGAVGAAFPLLFATTRTGPRALLAVMAISYAVAGLLLCCVPFMAGSGVFGWLADRLDGRKPGRRRVTVLRTLDSAAVEWRGRLSATPLTIVMAAAISGLNATTLWVASIAIGAPVPFWLIMALFPSTLIGGILPIGVAGLGGYQLLAIAVFAPFGVEVRTVATMTLLQSTIAVAVQTMLGLGWAAIRRQDVVAAIRGPAPSPP